MRFVLLDVLVGHAFGDEGQPLGEEVAAQRLQVVQFFGAGAQFFRVGDVAERFVVGALHYCGRGFGAADDVQVVGAVEWELVQDSQGAEFHGNVYAGRVGRETQEKVLLFEGRPNRELCLLDTVFRELT